MRHSECGVLMGSVNAINVCVRSDTDGDIAYLEAVEIRQQRKGNLRSSQILSCHWCRRFSLCLR